jgi:hypothetical protein
MRRFLLSMILFSIVTSSVVVGDSAKWQSGYLEANKEATAIQKPIVRTLYAVVGHTAARLWGQIEYDGGEACQRRFRCKREGRDYTYYSWYGSYTTGKKFDLNLGGFSLGGLTPDRKYCFSVQARNSAGESEWSDEQSFTTGKGTLRIASTPGGTVEKPGEGLFQYELGSHDEGSVTSVEAMADPNYQFANWTGTAVDACKVLNPNAASTRVMVNGSYTLIANFVATFSPIYVDDAPGDTDPNDSDISDPCEDGTWEHPFDMIQKGIDVAADGYTVYVLPGVYYENVDLKGKNITVMSLDPNSMLRAVADTIIDGNYVNTVVTFDDGEDSNCVLNGFTITRGRDVSAGGIYCYGSSPTVCNCLIVGNRAYNDTGSGLYCIDSNAVFENCTISGNYASLEGAGLYLCESDVVIVNSIIWDNLPQEIKTACGLDPVIAYSDIVGKWPKQGNISADPCFINTGYWNINGTPEDPNDDLWIDGDYHLKSQAGRWDPNSQNWIVDDVTSPCIDAGDPNSPIGDEPDPNGGRINIGTYGGTSEASKSL